MAEGRMLKRRITASKKMANLRTDKARLLWFFMLPFTDVDGRIEADCEDIRDEIIRKQRKGYSLTKIEECLQDLNRVGLIILYTVNGRRYLEFTRFWEEQSHNRNREAKSTIPPSPQRELTEQSQSNPLKLSKVKLSKDNNKYMSIFDEARKLYKGTKRGLKTEFEYFCKKHKDWQEVLPLLKPAIEKQIAWRKEPGFKPEWKNFKSWIYNRYWEYEIPIGDKQESIEDKHQRLIQEGRI